MRPDWVEVNMSSTSVQLWKGAQEYMRCSVCKAIPPIYKWYFCTINYDITQLFSCRFTSVLKYSTGFFGALKKCIIFHPKIFLCCQRPSNRQIISLIQKRGMRLWQVHFSSNRQNRLEKRVGESLTQVCVVSPTKWHGLWCLSQTYDQTQRKAT